MGPTAHHIAAEAHRVECECAHRAQAHGVAASVWGASHLVIGALIAILAAVAAAIVLTDGAHSALIAAAIAISVSALTALTTALHANDRASEHQIAATRFETIRNESRILQRIDSRLQDEATLASDLKALVRRESELVQSSPRVWQWAMRRAEFRISSGSHSPLIGQAAEILAFDNVADVYQYVASKIESAQRSVDDITWGSERNYRTQDELKAYEGYLKAVQTTCRKGKVHYREVSSLANEDYFRRSIGLVQRGDYNYQLRFYDTSSVPLISYITIDGEEAILGFYRAPVRPTGEEVYLRVTDGPTLDLLKDYFETLWIGATTLKEGSTVNWQAIAQIGEQRAVSDEYLTEVTSHLATGEPSACGTIESETTRGVSATPDSI